MKQNETKWINMKQNQTKWQNFKKVKDAGDQDLTQKGSKKTSKGKELDGKQLQQYRSQCLRGAIGEDNSHRLKAWKALLGVTDVSYTKFIGAEGTKHQNP